MGIFTEISNHRTIPCIENLSALGFFVLAGKADCYQALIDVPCSLLYTRRDHFSACESCATEANLNCS